MTGRAAARRTAPKLPRAIRAGPNKKRGDWVVFGEEIYWGVFLVYNCTGNSPQYIEQFHARQLGRLAAARSIICMYIYVLLYPMNKESLATHLFDIHLYMYLAIPNEKNQPPTCIHDILCIDVYTFSQPKERKLIVDLHVDICSAAYINMQMNYKFPFFGLAECIYI